MRRTFAQTLVEIAERDARVLLLTGDLGYTVLEPFAERFPERYFNVGVAEQNMIGLATGLAEAGFLPFTYSIATFATLRPYEFIRNGPVAHRLPVRVVGIGSGFDYGPNGQTHHALEDIGALRLQRGLTLIAPADAAQARTALLATWDLPGPCYYRLAKDDEPRLAGLDGRFELGRAQTLGAGDDLLLVALGDAALGAAAAIEALRPHGLAATLMVVSSLEPTPRQDLVSALARVRAVLTVETHSIIGGLGSLVAEIVAEERLPCRLRRCGATHPPDGRSGSRAFLERRHGFDRDSLVEAALDLVRRARDEP